MRHRFGNITCMGIGNSDPVILDNNKHIEPSEFWNAFVEDLVGNFKTIADWGGFDFHIGEDNFMLGIEPAYDGDDLQIIKFNFSDKDKSYIRQGRAFGAYGCNIVSKYRFYGDYKRKSKFVRFIDKWYEKLADEFKLLTHQHEDKGE